MNQPIGNQTTEPRGKYRKGLEAEARLAAAAAALIAGQGYAGASIAEIAQAAATTKNQLFHHFKSKEELALAAVARCREEWRAQLFVPAAIFPDPQARLDRVFGRCEALAREGWPYARLLPTLLSAGDRLPPALAAAARACADELAGYFRAAVKELKTSARLRSELRARELASWLLLLLFGMAGGWALIDECEPGGLRSAAFGILNLRPPAGAQP